eukprot:CAMPEP_0118640390 /NCGR_PEP_ID=MMETSP0785-20121206/4730_1 /TAXON_ID=91992 /ORGANISM="Bolidomonas pacifica, Strain CCMP 1866" /LENGTH=485 /DNA_ID=CAMNT_0006531779 /DNA_START=271 /DNA_END=1728 /DNA_ORIENTATION=+
MTGSVDRFSSIFLDGKVMTNDGPKRCMTDTQRCALALSTFLTVKDSLSLPFRSAGSSSCRGEEVVWDEVVGKMVSVSASRSSSSSTTITTRSSSSITTTTSLPPFIPDVAFFKGHLLDDPSCSTFSSDCPPPYQKLMIECYGYRRTLQAYMSETCELCGESEEITFLNVMEGKNVCRGCWCESPVAMVNYCKKRFRLDDDDLSSIVTLRVGDKRALELIRRGGTGKRGLVVCSLRAAHELAKEKAELEGEDFVQEKAGANILDEPMRTGEFFGIKKHLGLVHLHKPSASDATMRVVCSRLSLEEVRMLPGCSNVEEVSDNLFLALLLATPPKPNETSFCFGIAKLGVEMDCMIEEMYKSLSREQVKKLECVGILDNLDFKGVKQEASIHCGNVRVIGVKWGRKPVIELMGRNAVFISRYHLHVENVQFFDRIRWENCLAEQTNNAYISLKDCDRLVLTVEIEGEYDEEGGDNGIKIKEDGNCTTM